MMYVYEIDFLAIGISRREDSVCTFNKKHIKIRNYLSKGLFK